MAGVRSAVGASVFGDNVQGVAGGSGKFLNTNLCSLISHRISLILPFCLLLIYVDMAGVPSAVGAFGFFDNLQGMAGGSGKFLNTNLCTLISPKI
jgi:hypothetical protein